MTTTENKMTRHTKTLIVKKNISNLSMLFSLTNASKLEETAAFHDSRSANPLS